jgi:hypothetical protein
MTSRINRQSAEEEDALLSALLFLHRKKQERAREAEPNPRYARILDHFQGRARRLQEERVVTEELLERLFDGGKSLPPGAPHQELTIQGAAGGVAAGRLRVRNAAAETASFELVVGAPLEGERRVLVSCEPKAGTLLAGGTELVRVRADLGDFRAGEVVTVALECRWRTGRDYLWLSVQAHGAR